MRPHQLKPRGRYYVGTKICKQCQAEKDIELFHKVTNRYTGVHPMSICKDCYKSNQEAQRLKQEEEWEARRKAEDQVCTWSSNCSRDTTPVALIHIDQKLRLVLGVSSVYLCQFVADVAFRHCSIRNRTFLFEMQPNGGQTLRGSACPHLRALFINLKDSSK
jgi:hypothetical protein